eukprot:scaffold45739_cov31-Tisochrysis_lutea.AAC.4
MHDDCATKGAQAGCSIDNPGRLRVELSQKLPSLLKCLLQLSRLVGVELPPLDLVGQRVESLGRRVWHVREEFVQLPA